MKKIKFFFNKLCYGAFYARKNHPSNPPDNHDLDTLIQTEAIFIGTSTVFFGSIVFSTVGIFPNLMKFAPFIAITMIVLAIVIPMLLFLESRFMKVVKEWEDTPIENQLSAKKLWRTFFWTTWAIAIILILIGSALNFFN